MESSGLLLLMLLAAAAEAAWFSDAMHALGLHHSDKASDNVDVSVPLMSQHHNEHRSFYGESFQETLPVDGSNEGKSKETSNNKETLSKASSISTQNATHISDTEGTSLSASTSDAAGLLRLLWGIPDAAAQVGHIFSLPIPHNAFQGSITDFQVSPVALALISIT